MKTLTQYINESNYDLTDEVYYAIETIFFDSEEDEEIEELISSFLESNSIYDSLKNAPESIWEIIFEILETENIKVTKTKILNALKKDDYNLSYHLLDEYNMKNK